MKKNPFLAVFLPILIGVGLSVASLCGCATSGRIGATLEPAQETAQLVLIRPPNPIGNLATYYVTLDGREIFALRAGEYTKLAIPSGKHTLAIKSYGGRDQPDPAAGETIEAINGATLYFTIATAYTTKATLQRITDDQATFAMDRCGFVPETRLSNRETE